jgi:hypothetical protein
MEATLFIYSAKIEAREFNRNVAFCNRDLHLHNPGVKLRDLHARRS